jgi:hypothetical protein
MRRSPRLVFVLTLAGCASSGAGPLLDAGTGSNGAGGLIGLGGFGVGGSENGVGGFGLGGAGGTLSAVDASACAPFDEAFMPACVACLDVSCCDVAAMCFAVSDCFGYASCQQNCPPAPPDGGGGSVGVGGGSGGSGAANPCLAACAQNYPMAGAPFAALAACLHMSCPVCPF